MSMRINAKTTRSTLEEYLGSDANLLKDASAFLTFATTVASGEPLSLAAGLALITRTAGAAITASLNLIKRLSSETPAKSAFALLPTYDRFRVLFYVTCQRAFIEAM
jgi:hypothetical protein